MRVWAVALALAALPAGADPVPSADIVILGEVHDNPAHHATQAGIVAQLAPAAILFEMLLPAQAAAVTPANRADAAALADALDWNARGWPDFSLYYPILAAAPSAAVVGGDVPREAVLRALTEGAAAVFGDEAARYGLDRPPAPAEQRAREAEMAAAHCDLLPEALLPGMVEAQRLRDAVLARAAREAFVSSGGPVVVIAGTGHARRDRGVPAKLALAAPELSVFSLGQFEVDPGPDAPFDRVIVTDRASRGDPCAGVPRSAPSSGN